MTRLLFLLVASLAVSGAAPIVKVQIRTSTGTRIVAIPLEQYTAAVMAGEASVFQSTEALKAMSVAARTYAVRQAGRHRAEGFDFCDTTHCQRLELNSTSARLEAAVESTAGELLWYQGTPAFTPYTRDCGGRTEESGAVWPDLAEPYLTSHADPYCSRTGRSNWQWNADPRQIAQALIRASLRTPEFPERITIASHSKSNRASILSLNGSGQNTRISASSFRFAIGRDLGWNTLRSDRYEIHSSNGRIYFEGSGSGHGVGLCQAGAEQMGLEGRSYKEILAFYYPGTSVGLTGRGLSWQRLAGDSVALFTTQTQQDRPVLASADRLARKWSERIGIAVPQKIEIRVYPDLDTFRNATGEPGWVAAHTQGRSIHLQPVAVLRAKGTLESVMSHELLHVFLESQQGPAMPLWFREGLTEYLSGAPLGASRIPSDGDLAQTADPVRARRAYTDAARVVADLVKRYGESAVLAWVRTGIPREVTNASKSQATQKSK